MRSELVRPSGSSPSCGVPTPGQSRSLRRPRRLFLEPRAPGAAWRVRQRPRRIRDAARLRAGRRGDRARRRSPPTRRRCRPRRRRSRSRPPPRRISWRCGPGPWRSAWPCRSRHRRRRRALAHDGGEIVEREFGLSTGALLSRRGAPGMPAAIICSFTSRIVKVAEMEDRSGEHRAGMAVATPATKMAGMPTPPDATTGTRTASAMVRVSGRSNPSRVPSRSIEVSRISPAPSRDLDAHIRPRRCRSACGRHG